MQKIIIADTSCLILLHKIGEFDLLQKLYGEIIITSEIKREFGDDLPEWVITRDPVNNMSFEIISATVDRGEASAIALALEHPDSLLILDDFKARRLAAGLNLKYTGTIGILPEAKLRGHVQSVKLIIARIKQTNFHLSDEVERRILIASGESA